MSTKYRSYSAVTLQHEIKKLGSNVIGVELGVWTGFNMAHLLEECSNIDKLYGIDPYQPYQDWNRYINKEMMDAAKQTALNNIKEFKTRGELLIKTSEEAAESLNKLDFIFIDGDHSFEMCYKDLNLWYNRIRPGGLFSGHDFSLPGVNKALQQFRKERNISGFFKVVPNDVWFWIKD